MNDTPKFPDDENGCILRRMHDAGDDLTKARTIDFCFVFPKRNQALDFAKDIDDRNCEVCLSFYAAKNCWQIIVKNNMVPDYSTITALELRLMNKAEAFEGSADGWGCMRISKLI